MHGRGIAICKASRKKLYDPPGTSSPMSYFIAKTNVSKITGRKVL
jgi:hypothetical protein